jgi:hypothetical protein
VLLQQRVLFVCVSCAAAVNVAPDGCDVLVKQKVALHREILEICPSGFFAIDLLPGSAA